MANSVFYVQPCPACGRNQQVRVAYLGKAITCAHCNADFVAQQPQTVPTPTASQPVGAAGASGEPSPSESGIALLDRADQLLLKLAKQRDAALNARAKATA